MSKVVKGVGRAVTKVVKGVTNVVKKVASSKLGKVVLTAAAIYFGGAALTGAFGGGAAGAAGVSGLSGAATNIGAAWSSLTTAGGQLMAGNIGNAFSSLGSGMAGNAATMAADGTTMLVNGVSQATLPAVSPAAAPASQWVQSPTGLNVLASEVAGPAANSGSGIISKMMASKYAAPALISGSTQLIGSAMQGYGAQKEQERQEKLADEERARYNRNIGAPLWG